MRLSELRAKPSDIRIFSLTSGSWRPQIGLALNKQGYQTLGMGSFGTVFKHPKQDKVLKVFGKDRFYPLWVKFCRANPNNPYLPKFRSNLLTLRQDSIFAIFIEELEPYPSGDYSWPASMTTLIDHYDYFFGDADVDQDTQTSIERLASASGKAFQVLREDQNFMKVAEFLRHYSDNLDIRDENLMLRKSQVVITDPLAY